MEINLLETSFATTDPATGAIVMEHIFSEVAHPEHRICVVNTDAYPSQINGYRHKYSCFAYPSRAMDLIASGKDEMVVDA